MPRTYRTAVVYRGATLARTGPLSRTCPLCGAKPGYRCLRLRANEFALASGATILRPHRERWKHHAPKPDGGEAA